MSRGGKREGAGRRKGTTNRRVKKLRSVMREVAIRIGEIIPDAFEGDGHAFMVAVYKDPRIDLETRLDAAAKAARYEKPTLQAIEHSGNQDKPVQQVTRIERVIVRPANPDR
jgi:hypothetical protein